MFYDKFIDLCSKRKKAPSAVAMEIGLSRPTVNRWKNGGGVTDATKKRIADYFSVSVDYFKDEKENPSTPEGGGISEMDKTILSIFRAVPEHLQPILLEILRATANTLKESPGLSLEDLQKLK